MVLDGKEVDVKLGTVGSASIDLHKNGDLEVAVSAKVNLIAELEKLAQKTATPYDDAALAWVKGMLAKL